MPTTVENIANNVQTGQNIIGQGQEFINAHQDQFATANQLWKQYGKPLNIPFATWLNDEMMKAKSTGVYKEGMRIDEIVKSNRAGSSGAGQGDGAESDSNGKTIKPFQIGGLNGYAVLGVTVVLLGLGIYWASGKFFPSKAIPKLN